MASVDRQNIEAWKLRFRRKFTGAEGIAALDALSDTWAADAAEVVTFTSGTMEGGQASGMLTGNKMEVLTAAEELLSDPLFLAGITAPMPRVIQPDYRLCQP